MNRIVLSSLLLSAIAGCGNAAPIAFPGPAATAQHEIEPNALVDFVVDGDTIDVIIDGRDERVRLTGIDTPEVAHDASASRPSTPGECFGEQATAFTSSLLPVGTPVRLERDVVGRDDYGRILAYVYRADDGIFVNYELVRNGYAQPLTIPPNVTFSEVMVEAAREAEAADVGLWSACPG